MNDSKNPGISFERLVGSLLYGLSELGSLYTVEHNQIIEGPDGGRQFDLVIKSQLAGISFTTIVECKDKRRKSSVEEIDALESKKKDIAADKAVLVSQNGFSKTAKRKADRVRITLLTVEDPVETILGQCIEMPVYIRELNISGWKTEMRVVENKNNSKITAQSLLFINGKSLTVEFEKEMMAGNIPIILSKPECRWCPSSFGEDLWIVGTDGEKIQISNLSITFGILPRYYLGYLNDFRSRIALENHTDKSSHVFVDIRELFSYQTVLRSVEKDQIPELISPHPFNVVRFPVGMQTIKFGTHDGEREPMLSGSGKLLWGGEGSTAAYLMGKDSERKLQE